MALAFKSVGKLIKERRERRLLPESSLSSSERIRSESDASRYRHRTESEGPRDRQRSSGDATPARKRRASAPTSRNKAILGPSSLSVPPPEDAVDSAGRLEVIPVQVHRDVTARRQAFANEPRDAVNQRTVSLDAYFENEKQYGMDVEHREADEKKNLSGILEDGREEYLWEDRTKG